MGDQWVSPTPALCASPHFLSPTAYVHCNSNRDRVFPSEETSIRARLWPEQGVAFRGCFSADRLRGLSKVLGSPTLELSVCQPSAFVCSRLSSWSRRVPRRDGAVEQQLGDLLQIPMPVQLELRCFRLHRRPRIERVSAVWPEHAKAWKRRIGQQTVLYSRSVPCHSSLGQPKCTRQSRHYPCGVHSLLRTLQSVEDDLEVRFSVVVRTRTTVARGDTGAWTGTNHWNKQQP